MSQATVLLGHLQPLIDAAKAGGVDLRMIEEKGAGGEIAIADYFRLQREIGLASDDLTAQLSSRKLTYKTGSFVVSQLQRATSLLGAMEGLVEYFNMMHGDAYNSLRFSDRTVSLVVDDSSFPYSFRDDQEFLHTVGDCLLIKIHCLLDSLSKGAADKALKRVRLQRKRGEICERQNRFWSVPIEYGVPAYELVYDYDVACQPSPMPQEVDLSSDGLFARVINYLEEHRPATEDHSIVARMLDLIDGGMTRQSDVARRLGMSVATLRRRLGEEGVSFRDLLLETRLRQAEAMLKRGCSVAHATEELDYSDIRAFNRAFKRWKGITPAAFAERCHADAKQA